MPTYKSSVSIEASPEVVFAFVRDPHNFPRFLGEFAEVEPTADEEVRVTMTTPDPPVDGVGFHVHEGRHPRVEWSSEPCHGRIEVLPEGEVASVTLEVRVEGGTDVDARIDAALFALKDLVETQPAN